MSKSKLQNTHSPKGMHDILPQDQPWGDKIRQEIDYIADYYNFQRIDTVLMERAEVFEKSFGDRFWRRPEGTAGILRADPQDGLTHLGQPLKLFYFGPMFRKEQPQA